MSRVRFCEEVEWHFVEYVDNQHVIDLISKRPLCLFGLLDEASKTGATDKTLVQELMTGAETGNAGGYVGPDARKYLP